MFELNNKSNVFNILYIPYNIKEVRHTYKSKHNLNRENQVLLLMITDGKKWHYLAVKSLYALFREITSRHERDFYCLNYFHSFRTKHKLKKHKNVYENHDYFYVEMPEKDNKILKYKYGEKSMKVSFIIYADLESLLEKMNTCHDNPEKSSRTKINKHTRSGYSFFTYCSLDSSLNMEDITDAHHGHAKRVFKSPNNKNLGAYHDLYVQSDILLLADVSENFRNKCIEIYELDPAHFLSATPLAWKVCFKKTEVKLEFLTDADMLLMVEKGIRGGICHAIHRYAKANNRYMKNYDKNKELSYIQYLDVNNLYGWPMSQKLPVDGFKLKKKYVKI